MAVTALLLVEDDTFVRSALTRALGRTGVFSVTPVEHGARALEVLETQPVDAILTDLQMPVMDGLTLLGSLLERGIHIPVAVMTGQQITGELHARLRQFGIAASFTKPIELSVLADELQRALSPMTVGRLAGVTIFGFLQLLELERKTVQIVVRSGGEEGRLYFDEGALVHGETRWSRGLEAIYEIVTWPDPRLELFYHRSSRDRTVTDSLQHILMEAARLLDESGRAAVVAPSDVAPEAPAPAAAPAITVALDDLMAIDGAVGAAVVDASSGVSLGAAGAGDVPNLELFSEAATELMRAEQRALSAGTAPDAIEDVVITFGRRYHVIRPLRARPSLFVYVVLDRRAIVGMARLRIAALARRLVL